MSILKDPIDLLKERLKEIDSVKCSDIDFIRYKQKYVASIALLELNNFKSERDSRFQVSPMDREYIKRNYSWGKKDFLARRFNVSTDTITRILKEK